VVATTVLPCNNCTVALATAGSLLVLMPLEFISQKANVPTLAGW
jgi:hypothetical protein